LERLIDRFVVGETGLDLNADLGNIFENRYDLVANFIKSFILPYTKSREVVNETKLSTGALPVHSETPDIGGQDYEWTKGSDPSILHRRKIDIGAFGEVHEVTPFKVFILY
jgi:hypothetical protein